MHSTTIGGGQGEARTWHQQAGEGDKAFAAFQQYLALGSGRDLRSAAGKLGRCYSLIRRWSARHHWRERARAHDEAQGWAAEDERISGWRAFAQRQAEEVQQLWRLAFALLHRFVSRDPATGQIVVDPRLGPKEVLGLMKVVGWLLAQVSERGDRPAEAAEQLQISWGGALAEEAGAGEGSPALRRALGLSGDEITAKEDV